MRTKKRLIRKPPANEAVFRSLMEQLSWPPRKEGFEKETDTHRSIHYEASPYETEISYTIYPTLQVDFVEMDGPSEDVLRSLPKKIFKEISFFSPSELVSWWDQAANQKEKIRALLHLAFLDPLKDSPVNALDPLEDGPSELNRVMKEALQHPELALRQTALLTFYFWGLTEQLPLVEEALAKESDPKLRSQFQDACSTFQSIKERNQEETKREEKRINSMKRSSFLIWFSFVMASFFLVLVGFFGVLFFILSNMNSYRYTQAMNVWYTMVPLIGFGIFLFLGSYFEAALGHRLFEDFLEDLSEISDNLKQRSRLLDAAHQEWKKLRLLDEDADAEIIAEGEKPSHQITIG